MPDLEFAFLAHSALEVGGLLSVLGAGIDQVLVQAFPTPLALTFVAKLRWRAVELDQEHSLEIAVSAQSANDRLAFLSSTVVPAANPERPALPVLTTINLALPIEIPAAGVYTWTLHTDGHQMALLPVAVNEARVAQA